MIRAGRRIESLFTMRLPHSLAFIFVAIASACSAPVSTDAPASTEPARSQLPSPFKAAPQDHAPGFGGAVNRLDLACDGKGPFSGGTCVPADPNNTCQACVLAKCCEEQEACNSVNPMNSCAFGSILYDDRVVQGGEIACMMECLAERSSDGSLAGDASDLDACSSSCAASECDASHASAVTLALSACITGGLDDAPGGCRAECGL